MYPQLYTLRHPRDPKNTSFRACASTIFRISTFPKTYSHTEKHNTYTKIQKFFFQKNDNGVIWREKTATNKQTKRT